MSLSQSHTDHILVHVVLITTQLLPFPQRHIILPIRKIGGGWLLLLN
jgi:hypothetical protein